MLAIGLGALLFGVRAKKVVIVVESALASGYFLVIDSLVVLSLSNMDALFRLCVGLVTGTFALAFTASKNESARYIMKGMVLGFLLTGPLTDLLTGTLFLTWVGCDGYGERTERFPKGEPLGCDTHSPPFLVSFYVLFGLQWLLSFMMGKVALRFRKRVLTLATAQVGANLFVSSLGSLLVAIASGDDVRMAVFGARTGLTYAFTALGVCTMASPRLSVCAQKAPVLRLLFRGFMRIESKLEARLGGDESAVDEVRGDEEPPAAAFGIDPVDAAEAAATVIQSAFRGKMARRQVAEVRQSKDARTKPQATPPAAAAAAAHMTNMLGSLKSMGKSMG